MGIKQHLVALRRVRHEPEAAACAQLHVGDLHLVEHPAHKHAFLAPVELEGLAILEGQGHKGLGALASLLAPGADEVCHLRVPTPVTPRGDLNKKRTARAP